MGNGKRRERGSGPGIERERRFYPTFLEDMAIFAIIAALIIGASPSASPSAWQSVRPGDTVDEAAAALGQPLLRAQEPDGDVFTWNSLANPNAYVVLESHSGIVYLIKIVRTRPGGSTVGLTDPSGVSIGDTPSQVKAKLGDPTTTRSQSGRLTYEYADRTGVDWIYGFDGNALEEIALVDWRASMVGGRTSPSPQDGRSISGALVINAPTETAGVAFERYYASVSSGCGARWSIDKQALLSQDGRQYDRLDMTCPFDNSTKTMYFDITSFFGKL